MSAANNMKSTKESTVANIGPTEKGLFTARKEAAAQDDLLLVEKQKQVLLPTGDSDNPKGDMNRNGNDDDDDNDKETTTYTYASTTAMAKRKVVFTVLIMLVGCIAAVFFFSMGMVSLRKEQDVLFERRSRDITKSIEAAWNQYVTFGLWMQESCFSPLNETNLDTAAGRLGLCSREKYKLLVESIRSVGLDFKAAGMIPNITLAQRSQFEEEARAYYSKEYPNLVDCQGLVGFQPDNETGNLVVGSSPDEDFYWPVHYIEPVEGNEAAIDLDLYSHPARRQAIHKLVTTWQPVITPRIRLAQETEDNAFSVLSYHPGTKFQSYAEDARPTVFSSIAIRIPDLLQAAANDATVGISVVIFDSTDIEELPVFMGGSHIYLADNGTARLESLEERNLTDFESVSNRFSQRDVMAADRTWTVLVMAQPGTFEPSYIFVVLGGAIIVVASFVLAALFCSNMTRMSQWQQMKAAVEAEKAALILENAQKQARSERQLNEYIAHEVRNPLCSAITALSFVSAATNEPTSYSDVDARERLKEDVAIIDASLQFINELLRNMLDMHRAADKQMAINKAATDLRQDVLEPVGAILHMRGNSKVKICIDCPSDLLAWTDRMRLKQIVLNLSVNASKFVIEGYIRLFAGVVDGHVRICVEDSGPGIPEQKRNNLFAKFQESLDLLNQGTGMGLCLCKHLTGLLGGEIWLDESFQSGVEGFPGTRFVIDLKKTPPLEADEDDADDNDAIENQSSILNDTSNPTVLENGQEEKISTANTNDTTTNSAFKGNETDVAHHNHIHIHTTLPKELRVLFVDDDLIIRRLFGRALKRVAPEWALNEASNGETSLQLCQSNTYDLIFIDQYMASVEKQLLGTETVRALRAQGVNAKIVGLSANDMEEGFRNAGANNFMFKPFPCEKEAFTKELIRILYSHETHDVEAAEM